MATHETAKQLRAASAGTRLVPDVKVEDRRHRPAARRPLAPVGYKVVRVDLQRGEVVDLAVNKVNSPGVDALSRRLRTPSRCVFGSDGALYVVDGGEITIAMEKRGIRMSEGGSALWRIRRTGAARGNARPGPAPFPCMASSGRQAAVVTAEIGDQTFLDDVLYKMQWRDDAYDASIREHVPHLLGVNAVSIPGADLVAMPERLPALEDRLRLYEWLAENEPDLHARLYSEDQKLPAAMQPHMDLDAVLTAMDRVSANLERLQAIWDRAFPMLPSAPAGGSTNEYDDLVRAWNDLLKGLPSINGWTITYPIPGMDEIGMMYLDYMEIGEPPLGVLDAKEQPEKDLAEYRYRLSRARRRVIRDRLQELTSQVDNLLPQMLVAVARDDQERLDDPRVTKVVDAINEIERLMGDTATRQGRWSDLHRHIHFGQGHDWHDIHELDWPSVKQDIEAAGFSESDPCSFQGVDLGQLAASKGCHV